MWTVLAPHRHGPPRAYLSPTPPVKIGLSRRLACVGSSQHAGVSSCAQRPCAAGGVAAARRDARSRARRDARSRARRDARGRGRATSLPFARAAGLIPRGDLVLRGPSARHERRGSGHRFKERSAPQEEEGRGGGGRAKWMARVCLGRPSVGRQGAGSVKKSSRWVD